VDPRRSGAVDVEQPALELAGGDEYQHDIYAHSISACIVGELTDEIDGCG
jgi:hypothetical protein